MIVAGLDDWVGDLRLLENLGCDVAGQNSRCGQESAVGKAIDDDHGNGVVKPGRN